MKKMSKPFLTIDQQIEKLIRDKKLTIVDKNAAEAVLSRVYYYALIDGYKDLFYNPMTRQYKEGTTLEDILALYYFDESLRSLHFKYICHVEQRMRPLISYYFCEAYTNSQAESEMFFGRTAVCSSFKSDFHKTSSSDERNPPGRFDNLGSGEELLCIPWVRNCDKIICAADLSKFS